MSMSVSRQMHAIQTTSVTTLLDRTRVNVLRDLLKTPLPKITRSRFVTVRKLVHIIWETQIRMMLISVQHYIREVMKIS